MTQPVSEKTARRGEVSGTLVEHAKAHACDVIGRNKRAFARLSDAIFYFAEPGMQEYRTAALLTEILADEGFAIERNVSGFPTGFVATTGEGAPVIALTTEYDANPGASQQSGVTERREIVPGAPGHCEGHNVNAATTVAAAIAVKRAMARFGIRGTLKVFGCPAEEQLLSRPYYVRDGHFAGVDAAFRSHISGDFRTAYGTLQNAAISAIFKFRGAAAHAAMAPWKGRNALDAVMLMDLGMAQFREQMSPRLLAHRAIPDGGDQPNIVPAEASIWWYFRGPTVGGALFLLDQATRIAQGAAMMASCAVEVELYGAAWPARGDKVLAEIVQRNIEVIGTPVWTPEEQAFARAVQRQAGVPDIGLKEAPVPLAGAARQMPSSSDCGDISWVVPMAHLFFPGSLPNIDFHHWTAGTALTTSIAHNGGLAGARALAGSVIDILCDPSLLARVRQSFRDDTANVVYRPLLPPAQSPPLHLNRRVMEAFRPAMEAHYVSDKPTFSDRG